VSDSPTTTPPPPAPSLPADDLLTLLWSKPSVRQLMVLFVGLALGGGGASSTAVLLDDPPADTVTRSDLEHAVSALEGELEDAVGEVGRTARQAHQEEVDSREDLMFIMCLLVAEHDIQTPQCHQGAPAHD